MTQTRSFLLAVIIFGSVSAFATTSSSGSGSGASGGGLFGTNAGTGKVSVWIGAGGGNVTELNPVPDMDFDNMSVGVVGTEYDFVTDGRLGDDDDYEQRQRL
jgi:hypothetical protein